MTMTKGRLGRICLRCNKRYIPNSQYQKMCLKCSKKGGGKNKGENYVSRIEKYVKQLKGGIKI